ncbi:MAG: tyrosine-type recombinase/integrase [Deltaproteobacteria bacterium]|nr:tyrosine-type recombinase/integrase [Deltaproteobacteria bacterium]
MPASRGARILGPYGARDKWRLVIIDAGSRKSLVFSSQQQAEAAKSSIGEQLRQHVILVGEALQQFADDKRRRGCKELSVQAVYDRLSGFLPMDKPLAGITVAEAQKLYESLGERFATATHHAALKRAKELYRWAIEQGHVTTSPFAPVKPVGKARRGKPQLSLDEARKLSRTLRADAENRDELATALLLQLLLGLRSSEVLLRRVRDLDDGGRILVIPSGKTENARRRLECPEVLAELLVAQAGDKPAEQFLFGGEVGHGQAWMWKGLRRYCDKLGLPTVCPHSLRGLHSSLAVEAGRTSQEVAAQLGHSSFGVTALHYVRPGAIENTRIRKVSGLLSSGTKDPPLEHAPTTGKEALLAQLAALSEADLAKLLSVLPMLAGK